MTRIHPAIALVLATSCCSASANDISQGAIEDAMRRNVTITVPEKNWQCSGVMLGTDNVLTARHCQATDAKMYVNGQLAYVVRAGKDPDDDLLLLHVESEQIPDVTFGNPTVGDIVFAIFDSNTGDKGNFVRGYVMRVDKDAIYDSALMPLGMSGSALYDSRGRLIGINTKIVGRALPGGSGTEIFATSAVPIARIRAFLGGR